MTPIVRLMLVAAASTAYLGLAVWGEGGWHAFFARPALDALAACLFILSVASLLTSASLSSGEREDRGNRWVLIPLGVVGMLLGYLPAYTDRREFWMVDGDTIRWIGVGLFAVGGILRLRPVFVLGRRFSGLVAIQPGHTLVTSGIFGRIRNPSYLGLLINSSGWALAFRSWAGVALTALLIPPLVARMRSEERMLRSQFGAAYDAYFARTWRLVPGLY